MRFFGRSAQYDSVGLSHSEDGGALEIADASSTSEISTSIDAGHSRKAVSTDSEVGCEGTTLLVGASAEAQPFVTDGGDGLTTRALVGGALVGFLLCGSNMYFGLQTGWVTMGSVQSALVGFGMFQSSERGLSVQENVMLQTTAVAAATMPLSGGFLGVVPALEQLGRRLSIVEQLQWCLGLGFFGAFLAVPLRSEMLLRQRLEFPSGKATAKLIEVLHSKRRGSFAKEWSALKASVLAGALFSVSSALFPCVSMIQIFGAKAAAWGWMLDPSPAYIGQGAIMGLRSGISMLVGAILGFGILGPVAKRMGWAPGQLDDWKSGPTGFVVWVSLALMLGDSLASLGLTAIRAACPRRAEPAMDGTAVSVPYAVWSVGLAASTTVCVAVLTTTGLLGVGETLAAITCAVFVSVVAIRALGETDINPVSGVGKVSQLLFAFVSPGNVVPNLVAGAVAEAGAAQGGDMMQDLKTGLLVAASPTAQFHAQLLGSVCSIVFTVVLYALFSTVYKIPSPDLPAPTALVWLDMAQLCANGFTVDFSQSLTPICIIAFALGALSALSAASPLSPIALAVGMYLSPRFSMPRVFGAVAADLWRRWHPASHSRFMVVVASGFVLGEGVFSVLAAAARALGLHPLACESS